MCTNLQPDYYMKYYMGALRRYGGVTSVWDRRVVIQRVQLIAENGPITTARLTNLRQLAIRSAHSFVADGADRDRVPPGVRLRAG